jgi:hypothetical protein
MNLKRLVPLVVVFASTAHADVTRPQVNLAMAKAVAEIKQCGVSYKASFDWASYDALDWSKASESKQEWLGFEKTTLDSLGEGVDHVCADPDCKAALGAVDTIVYRVTDDKDNRLSATVDGKTLVFTNYTWGSTRFVDDFEKATRIACEAASLPPEPTHPPPSQPAKPGVVTPPAAGNAPAKPAVVTPHPVGNAPVKAGPASSVWDGTYKLFPMTDGGLCPYYDTLRNLKVAGGKFSLPWITTLNWRYDNKQSRIGHIDSIAHADGTVATTATFDAPIWQTRTVSTVKARRQLDSVDVKFRFSRDTDRTKLLALEITIPDQGTCQYRWESGRPPPPPPPPMTAAERREAERQQREDDERRQRDDEESRRKSDEEAARSERRSQCKDNCSNRNFSCTTRVEAQYDSCRNNCESSSNCYGVCSDTKESSYHACNDDENFCERDCDTR